MIYQDGYLLELNNPFSNLFQLLSINIFSASGNTQAKRVHELKKINHYIDNSLEILFQGLQSLSDIVSAIEYADRKMIKSLNTIQFFISAMYDLSAALSNLRDDARESMLAESYLN